MIGLTKKQVLDAYLFYIWFTSLNLEVSCHLYFKSCVDTAGGTVIREQEGRGPLKYKYVIEKVAYVKCQEANICSKSNNKGTNEGSSLVTPPIGIECVYHLSLLGVGTNSNFFGRI